MIQEEVNKDIRKYKEKFLGPLSAREVVCIGLGAGFTYLVKTIVLPEISWVSDEIAFLALICFLPFVAVGWIRIYGLYLEDFFKSASKTLTAPAKRTYDNGIRHKKKPVKTKKSKDKNLKRLS